METQIVLSTLFISITSTTCYYGFQYYKHRGDHPIRERQPLVVLFQAIGWYGLCFTFALLINVFPSAPAFFWYFFLTMFLNIIVSCTVLRFWALYTKFKLTRVITSRYTRNASSVSTGDPLEPESGNLLKYKRLLDPKLLVKFAIAVSILSALPIIFVFLDFSSFSLRSDYAAETVGRNYLRSVVAVGASFGMAIIVFCSHDMRNEKENFYIKTELSNQAALFMIIAIGYVLFMFSLFPYIFPLLVGIIGFCKISLYDVVSKVPLYLKRMDEKMKTRHVEIHRTSDLFLYVLKSHDACELFNAFVVKEFSAENLIFWKQTEMIKDKYAALNIKQFDEKIKQDFRAVKEEFLDPDAPFSINVSWEVRSVLIKAIDEMADITEVMSRLIEAQDAIFLLMFNDSFRRFFFTNDFKRYIDRVGVPGTSSATKKTHSL